jgi:hypothetical protein
MQETKVEIKNYLQDLGLFLLTKSIKASTTQAGTPGAKV